MRKMNGEEWKKDTIKQFNVWSEKKNRFLFEKRVNAILPFVPENASILDAGCGDGEMLKRLKDEKNLQLPIGIDIRKNMSSNYTISLIRGDVERLPFKNNYFDCIISTAVLEHLPHPGKAIREFKRILKPNALLIITTPNPFYSSFADIGALLKLKYKEGLETKISIENLKKMLDTDFSIIYSSGFLVAPVRIPLEGYIERIFQKYMNKLLLNQIVIAKNVGDYDG